MDINTYAVIPFLFFLIFYLRVKRKSNYGGNILLILYLIGSIFSVFVDLDIALPLHIKSKERVINALLYSFLLVLFLVPAFKIKGIRTLHELRFFKKKSIFLIVLSVAAWLSFIYLVPFAIASLTIDAVSIRNGLTTGDLSVLPKNIFTTIAVGIASFYPMFIFLFFMSYVQRRSLFITISMFVGGLAYVMSTFAFAGRDGLVFLTLILVIFYKFFYNVLDKKRISKYRKIFYILLVIGSMLLLRISNERFERQGGFYSTMHIGILGYGGMQPFIFNDILNDFTNYSDGNKSFLVFKELFTMNVDDIPEPEDAMEWQFGTFLTSFYKVSGMSSMIMISLIFLFVFYYLIPKINNALLPFRMIIVGFYFQFMVTGFFYFRLGNPAGNKYMIILTLLFLILIIRYKGIAKIKRT